MTKLAIVGANGQVGTELLLRFSGVPSVDLVPIVRTRAGSAFLRSVGVECLQGDVTDPKQAKTLLAGCDAVLNLAHADSYVSRQRMTNFAIQRAIITASPTDSVTIFCSTQMVYAPELSVRIPGTYGADKLLLERKSRSWSRAADKQLAIFRLGHVLGDLQAITRKIRAEVATGEVALPTRGEIPSNTIFVASVAAAVLKMARHEVPAGTYDLISSPQWSWSDIYRYYANESGEDLSIVDAAPQPRVSGKLAAALTKSASDLVLQQRVRERLGWFLRWMPETANERLYATYQVRRASHEIRELEGPRPPSVEPWRGVGKSPFPGLEPTLDGSAYPLPPMPRMAAWLPQHATAVQ